MTFTEAAEAVLKQVGKPLPVKKITQLAIEQNLLSHVGKTPEVTMTTRLNTMTKKDRGEAAIVRVKPGVFALREWGVAPAPADDDAEGEEAPEAAPAAVEAPAAPPAAARGRDEARAPKNDRGPRGDKPQRNDRPERSERSERPEKSERAPAAEKVEKTERVEKSERVERPSAPEKRERPEAIERVETAPVPPAAEKVEPVAPPVVAAPVVAAPPPTPNTPDEQERAERIAAAAQFYTEEEDDDEPVLGGPATDADKQAGNKRRRRRRGRGRGDRLEGDETTRTEGAEAATPGASEDPSRYTGEVPSAEAMSATAGEAELSGDTAPERHESATADEAPPTSASVEELGGEDLPRAEPRREERRDGRDGRDGRRDDRRDGRRDERGAERRPEDRRDERGEPRRDERPEARRDDRGEARREERPEERREGAEELGRDAADLVVSLLSRREDRQPVPLRALVEDGLRSGRLTGDPNLLAPALSAAVRADALRREARGERARLRIGNGRIGLVDWTLGPELVRAESDALIALERLREAARRHLLRRLNELPQPGFTELVVLLLERIGITGIRNARRPGLPTGELHLAGIARRAGEEQRVAVLVKRGGELGRERVIELRGSAHHYNNATAVWMLTTGNVLSGAREEAAQGTSLPVTLIDGVGLSRLFDEQAVGVRHASVAIPYPDGELLDALRGF